MNRHAKEENRMNFQRKMPSHIKVHVQILSLKISLQLVFFCDELESDVRLCSAQTLGLDRKVRDAATKLGDERLLAKLSEGDLVAIKARYHKSCLIGLYNRLRVACFKSPSDLEDDILYGVVVREVVEYIRESILSSENVTPVFKLWDLRNLTTRRLAEYNASKESIDRIHSTRLKEDILKELPSVSETRHGKVTTSHHALQEIRNGFSSVFGIDVALKNAKKGTRDRSCKLWNERVL